MRYADTDSAQTPPPQRGTQLVQRADIRQEFTDHRETDARTALTRGLAEYLESLSIEWIGGRQSRFLAVLQTWSEPEMVAVFPSAVVYATDAGQYEDATLTPKTIKLAGSGRFLREIAEVKLELTVEVWATDPVERMALAAMLEDALDPHEWMSGLRLRLPHYHGSHATYEKTGLRYEDSTDDSQKRWRKAIFAVTGNITQLRRAGVLPMLDLRIGSSVDDDLVIVHSVVASAGPRVVVVYEPGPAGMSGRDGRDGSGSAFTHVQAVPALVWTINHNLGYFPSIEVWDSLGREVEADVLNVTITQATVTFLAASTGSARCV
jgi:hypothetical protein